MQKALIIVKQDGEIWMYFLILNNKFLVSPRLLVLFNTPLFPKAKLAIIKSSHIFTYFPITLLTHLYLWLLEEQVIQV